MPIQYSRVGGRNNVILSKVVTPFDPDVDVRNALGELQGHLNDIQGQVYIISDMSALHPSFSDVVVGMAAAAYQKDSPLHDPRIKIVQVAKGEIFQDMVEWFKQEQYGQIETSLFESYDEALRYIDSVNK